MDLFILIIGCICLVASILVWLFGGEKYMKWYYQIGEIGDYRKYDKRKFKIVHSSALALVGLCAIWMSFNEETSIPLWIMIAIVFANYTLIYTVCKIPGGMDCSYMKRFLVIELALLIGLTATAQTMADDARSWTEGWKYAFSQEGRQNWKPEFTVRLYAGFVTEGPAITGGVRIDDKRTFGLMVWQGKTWIDAAPASVYSISTGLYMRRYFHLGQKDIVALYCDFAIGAGYVYKMNGGYMTNTETGETVKTTDYSKGDVLFAATLQPGIRFRFWKNLHLFLGPTVSTNTVGLHLGVGF